MLPQINPNPSSSSHHPPQSQSPRQDIQWAKPSSHGCIQWTMTVEEDLLPSVTKVGEAAVSHQDSGT